MKKVINLKAKLNQKIRDKAISRAKTRIVLAGKVPEDFDEEQLEIIVKEEEDLLISNAKGKGLLVLASLLGLSLWG
jgi:hypothetical protein